MIREMRRGEIDECVALVYANWGQIAASRCRRQALETFRGGDYAPVFYVYTDPRGDIAGFAAIEPVMLAPSAFNFIWLVIRDDYQKLGAGRELTEYRIAEVRRRGGTMIQLVTQKPAYFRKFGFFTQDDLGYDWVLMMRHLKTMVM
jgi:N-acetylglutamate synthase-like GNAT family acetyltransferase